MLVFTGTLLTGSDSDLSLNVVTSDVDGNEIAPSTVACEDKTCSSCFNSLSGL